MSLKTITPTEYADIRKGHIGERLAMLIGTVLPEIDDGSETTKHNEVILIFDPPGEPPSTYRSPDLVETFRHGADPIKRGYDAFVVESYGETPSDSYTEFTVRRTFRHVHGRYPSNRRAGAGKPTSFELDERDVMIFKRSDADDFQPSKLMDPDQRQLAEYDTEPSPFPRRPKLPV